MVEYYLLDKQGSYLCIDSSGKRSCFVVQTERSLDAWSNLYEQESDSIVSLLMAVKKRQKIPFFGIGRESWHIPSDEWTSHYYDPKVFEGRERYFWTQVELV